VLFWAKEHMIFPGVVSWSRGLDLLDEKERKILTSLASVLGGEGTHVHLDVLGRLLLLFWDLERRVLLLLLLVLGVHL
jgi:hypothetical protein